ncbi:hypothetical protein [Paraburkholderia sp. A3BS-1L]|uniref:hypothetical protein n=1 Tax=Paraburkholderia sp. A3BS-1L TaxID=3028375 RepID=UPI003DA877BF
MEWDASRDGHLPFVVARRQELWWNDPGRTLASTKGGLFRVDIAAPREARRVAVPPA